MVKIINYIVNIIKYRIFILKKTYFKFEGEDYQVDNLYLKILIFR